MPRNAPASAELVALRQEALACVALAGELFVLAPELVPEGVEGFVVRAVDVVAKSIGLKRLARRGIHSK